MYEGWYCRQTSNRRFIKNDQNDRYLSQFLKNDYVFFVGSDKKNYNFFINFIIAEIFMDSLPTFTWLTTFSQLVSRICHPSKEVQVTLRTIIVKLIVAHPQHCLWMMASVDNVRIFVFYLTYFLPFLY